ncbi:hypothetical protein MKX70_29555 [Paenibacillus sp. FSL R7-0312]|uniref:hypothetical protein n=1 Tax=unclassified Paenibacillus TaxID=185978 RepID=UPI0004F857FE|nr:hypothetical protein [Paenibacillus sp. FSL R5-0912]AIQ40340.1 hypothetical protein R50912_10140 [Paenibacillus sp. FSL R5-0912]
MRGRVHTEYRRLGFFAVETEDHDFSIIEVRSGLPSLGDELVGELNSLGEKQLYNDTTLEKLDLSIKFIHLIRDDVKRAIIDAVRGK